MRKLEGDWQWGMKMTTTWIDQVGSLVYSQDYKVVCIIFVHLTPVKIVLFRPGMNLQICFMNETASDNESPSSDNECPLTNPKPAKTLKHSDFKEKPAQRPSTLALQAFEQNSQLHPG